MFTGIIEASGIVKKLNQLEGNLDITIQSPFTHELKVDQSVAHNGVCLTVVDITGDTYTVTAIEETLKRSNLGDLKINDGVNLERCMQVGDRLDGHIVQGHVDQTAVCEKVEDLNGSWKYHFKYDPHSNHTTVEKGSICINGVSLTVVDSTEDSFSVAIIPYTYEHTNFKQLKIGSKVNLEFDIVGKYVARLLNSYSK